VLDADLNQHATKFGEKANVPNFAVISEVNEGNILQEMKAVYNQADMVVIDLPGGSSMMAVKALTKSHFVLIPAQHSILDARDAIPRSLIWTRVMPGFESLAARRVRADMENVDVPIFRSVLMNRSAFQEMFLRGQVTQLGLPAWPRGSWLSPVTKACLRAGRQIRDNLNFRRSLFASAVSKLSRIGSL